MLSFSDFIIEENEEPVTTLKWHTKRIRFVGGNGARSHKVHGIEDHLKLAKELKAMGYHPSIKQSKNGFYADVKWGAPQGVSFAQLLSKY